MLSFIKGAIFIATVHLLPIHAPKAIGRHPCCVFKYLYKIAGGFITNIFSYQINAFAGGGKQPLGLLDTEVGKVSAYTFSRTRLKDVAKIIWAKARHC